MTMTTASNMDDYLTLQEVTNTRQPDGSFVESWSDVDVMWGAVEDLSGREYFAARQVNADSTSKIVIRWREGVTPGKNRIKDGSTIYDIEHVSERGRKNVLELIVKRRLTE